MIVETVSNIEIANGGEMLLRLASGGDQRTNMYIVRLQVCIGIKTNMHSSLRLGQMTITSTG
jgi:hypothetical protein